MLPLHVSVEQLTPKYIHITINVNDVRNTNAKKAAIRYRLNQELKFLHKKEPLLNTQLYTSHLQCAAYWQDTWLCIQTSINPRPPKRVEVTFNSI
jgi:hypothetical protein